MTAYTLTLRADAVADGDQVDLFLAGAVFRLGEEVDGHCRCVAVAGADR